MRAKKNVKLTNGSDNAQQRTGENKSLGQNRRSSFDDRIIYEYNQRAYLRRVTGYDFTDEFIKELDADMARDPRNDSRKPSVP